jgi:hypothetical protein
LPDTFATPIWAHDHADDPWRAVAALFQVEFMHAYAPENLVCRPESEKGDWYMGALYRLRRIRDPPG